jgi:hypothetical protein
MKRLFILASAAIVALASCSKTQVVYNDAPEEIGFKTFTGAMTKAFVEWDAATSQMGVFAVQDGTTNYLDNKAFKKHSTEAYFVGADQAYYWPLGKTLDFVVYAPYTAGVTFDPATETLTWNVDNSGTNQTDVLFGGKMHTAAKQSAAMEMPLKHALAQVVVNIKADQDGVVTINSLNVTGTYQKETLSVDYTVPATPAATWTTAGTTKDMELFSSLALTTTDANNYCYVVPSAQTSIAINYTLTGGSPVDYPISLTANGNWEMGKKYVYNIEVGASEIKITPVVDEWIWDFNENGADDDAKEYEVNQGA